MGHALAAPWQGAVHHDDDVVQVGDLRLDLCHRRASRGDVDLFLTRGEVDLLELFMVRSGHVVTTAEIEAASGQPPGEAGADVQVRRLRLKIDLPFGRRTIDRTDDGYRMRSPGTWRSSG